MYKEHLQISNKDYKLSNRCAFCIIFLAANLLASFFGLFFLRIRKLIGHAQYHQLSVSVIN